MSAEGNGSETVLSPVDMVADLVPGVEYDLETGSAVEVALGGDGHDLALAMSDLIQDSNGEVVFLTEGAAIRSLALDSDAAVIDQGLVDQHVTAGGDDVSGFKYVEFANGVTLYFDPSLDVIVKSGDLGQV
jgi:hypothetical protein